MVPRLAARSSTVVVLEVAVLSADRSRGNSPDWLVREMIVAAEQDGRWHLSGSDLEVLKALVREYDYQLRRAAVLSTAVDRARLLLNDASEKTAELLDEALR